MKQNELWGYLSPEIELNVINVEQGYAGTELGGIDTDPTSPGESPILPGEDTGW